MTHRKILLLADAPWFETGYARIARSLSTRLAQDGHEVVIFSPGGFPGGKVQPRDLPSNITVVGGEFTDDRWGNASIAYHKLKHDPDLILTLIDCQGLDNYGLTDTPTWMWTPVDTWPIPECEVGILARADQLLVPSKWGLSILQDAKLEGRYLPYGIEPDDFYFDAEGREYLRNGLHLNKDTFLIGMIGLNYPLPDRKGYTFALQALATFILKNHPGADIKVWIEANPNPGNGAPNLMQMRDALGLGEHVAFPLYRGATIRGSQRYIRHLLSSCDVLLQSSMTEGFGLPIIEAQACGCPVVVNDCTSMTELVIQGALCQPKCTMFVDLASNMAIPDVDTLVDGLEKIYATRHIYRDPAIYQQTRDSVMASYSWDRLYADEWRPLIESIPAPRTLGETGDRLLLGCGNEKRKGYIHHDLHKHAAHVDVAHDLESFPWPWPDESFDYVEMGDVLEHLKSEVVQVLDECWRILRPGGHLFIRTCEQGGWQHAFDPTHVRGFQIHSFDYFDPQTEVGKQYGMYTQRHWQIIKRSLKSGDVVVVLSPRKGDALPVTVTVTDTVAIEG